VFRTVLIKCAGILVSRCL